MTEPLPSRPFLAAYTGLAVAGSAAYAMSTLFSAMKPVLLTRFVEQVGFSEAQAGLVVAMPFVGIAAASLLMRGALLRLPYWLIALLFGSVLAVCELLSGWFYGSAPAVLLAQLLSGLCVGVLMGTISRYIATTHAPDKLFGFVDMMAVFLMSFMVYGVGVSVAAGGLTDGYLFAAALSMMFAAALFAFRGNAADRHGGQPPAAPLRMGIRPLAVVAMGVLFVTCSGLGFAFMFTLARDLGMSYDVAGTRIGVLLFVSAFACQAGGWASARFGPARPLMTAFVACAVGWYLAIHASSAPLFLAALVPAVFSLQFNFPILLALSGSLDAHGRWAGIATPLLTSGFAWAAIVAGQVVSIWGIAALANVTAAGMVLCAVLLAIAGRGR